MIRTRFEAELSLWHRLRQYHFADASAGLDLRRRLAREQGWSLGEVDQALEEYRRFCFLACVAGHAVTPSEEVDQVWHLHLTYTEDYWQHFCPQVLGRTLHHGPTRGGPAEARRYRAQYVATLQSYERYFGPPPERWWPGVTERFCRPSDRRWIDRRQYWLIPKPRLPRAWAGWLAGLGLPIQAHAIPNPLDWTAWPFLEWYLALMLAVGVLTWIGRRAWRGPRRLVSAGGLSTAEVAYLSGGAERAFDATVADLLDQGYASWDANEKRLRLERREGLQGLAALLAPHLAVEGDPGRSLERVRGLLEQPRPALERRGLILDEASERRAGWLLAVLPAALTLLGVAKILVGLSRDKPVLFITLLTVIMALFTLYQFLLPPSRTRTGDAVLRALEARHERARRAPGPGELGLAVALVGSSVLAGTAFAGYHELRQPANNDGNNSSSSDSDGGGGSGCGGCGGGD